MNVPKFRSSRAGAVGIIAFSLWAATAVLAANPGYNVLFIAADDLRCDLGCFGNPEVKTPNLDRLAQRGRLFTRAYCQEALCNPSRSSLMTGLTPGHTGIYNNKIHFREKLPDIVTLPQLFKQNGYETRGLGKLYHNYDLKIKGDPASWSAPEQFHWGPHFMDWVVPDQPLGSLATNRGPATQCVDVPDDAYIDGRIADAAVKALRELKDKPFFLGVGFWKPHLPYNAPKKYWNLYDRAKLAGQERAQGPDGAPGIAFHYGGEVRSYANIPKSGPISATKTSELRHGYLAGVSFVDANVGKLLDELDGLGLTEKTIIVFWGDNGYHLGEQAQWGKETDFEIAARVPLIISLPGLGAPGAKSESLVELLDLYPTLADLCGLTAPHKLDGKTLHPVLDDPSQKVHEAAFTQCPRPAGGGPLQTMGYSVRTDNFCYTEWRMTNRTVLAREFYDLRTSLVESTNLINSAAQTWNVAEHVRLLRQRLGETNQSDSSNAADTVPGVVIDHRPASSGLFLGSPSIAILPNGDYIASHDFFGPKSGNKGKPMVCVFQSQDRGSTWSQIARVEGLFWHNLFEHRGAVYLMGADKEHGRIVIRRSIDGGRYWSEPRDRLSGLLTERSGFHTAPVPVVEHAGRLWRGFEDANGGKEWGKQYRAGILSVPADADLLVATNWMFSNFLPSNPGWLNGDFNGWLEGNAVAIRNGGIVDFLRVDTSVCPERAAIVNVSEDGQTLSFNPTNGIVKFPGGAKKFTIRFDAKSGCYWSLATVVPPGQEIAGRPGAVRNTLALTCSLDLLKWEVRAVLLRHPDAERHGFQYADWQFDGDDIIAVVRTAYDDGEGGAHNFHDANFITFHRWKNFRDMNSDDAPSITTSWNN